MLLHLLRSHQYLLPGTIPRHLLLLRTSYLARWSWRCRAIHRIASSYVPTRERKSCQTWVWSCWCLLSTGRTKQLTSSTVYLTMTSALSSWKSRKEIRIMSPWLIQTCRIYDGRHQPLQYKGDSESHPLLFKSLPSPTLVTFTLCLHLPAQVLTITITKANKLTFFLIFPLIWANLFSPSKHWASIRPLPSILRTWAYSVVERQKTKRVQGNQSANGCPFDPSRKPKHSPHPTSTMHSPWPSSLNTNSRFSSSFSFFPLRLFLPP